MNPLKNIANWLVKKRMHQVDFFRQYPIEVQQEWLERLLYKAKDTEWGKAHHFSSIKSLKDFKQNVPIQTYESLQPFIQKIQNGKQNILWHSPIKWFAKSSGTTVGKSKYIPVSQESLDECHYKGGKDMMAMYYDKFTDSKVFKGKSLMIGGSSQISQHNANAYYGDLSAIIIENLPYWAHLIQTPSKAVSLLPDWEEKINRMAEIVAQENVTTFSGVPSWNLILLRKVLEVTGKKDISQVWKNLEVYVHGGVNFDAYREQYTTLIPSSKMKYLQTYNASEGFFGIQDTFDGEDDMLLMLDYGIFYEFLPLEELGSDSPQTLQLNEVEIGKNYALIISTNAGLWRYMIGDTIQFTQLFPFKIKVTGRTKYFINLMGEELIEDNVNTALKKSCEQCHAIVNEYTIAPIFPDDEGKAAHEWAIEFEKTPTDIDYFTSILDNALKAVNSDYEAKRYKDMALQTPKINVVKKGSFFHLMKNKGKIGGQNKVPRMSMKRDFLEEVLDLDKNLPNRNRQA